MSVTKRRFGVAMDVKEGELLWVRHNWESEAEATDMKIASEKAIMSVEECE